MADKSLTKSRSRTEKFDVFAIALDVGSTSGFTTDGTSTDLDKSKQVVDWMLSRRIFQASNDRFSLLFFGHELTENNIGNPNVYVHNNEFEKAQIDWLRILENEVSTNIKTAGDYISALYVAADTVKVFVEGVENPKSLQSATIVLVSNLSGLKEFDQGDVFAVSNSLEQAGVETLIIIGPDFTKSMITTKEQGIGIDFFSRLIELGKVHVEAFSFDECFSKLKFFQPKQGMIRAQPFKFEIGDGMELNLQMFVKNTEGKVEAKFQPVAEVRGDSGEVERQPLSKKRRFDPLQKQDEEDEENGSREIGREDLIKSYKYGVTDVPIPAILGELIAYPKKDLSKQLKLIQFAKREHIFPQFITSACRYFIPHENDSKAFTMTSALVQAMLQLGAVAICRYAYSAAAKPKLACLIPKLSKKYPNLPVLIHYELPFQDDFRYYNFPSLSQFGLTGTNENGSLKKDPTKPTEYQLDCVDAFINKMLLAPVDDEERAKMGPKEERLRKSEVRSPKIQHYCQSMRIKAMYPDEPFRPLSDKDRARLLEQLSPPSDLVDEARDTIDALRHAFPLRLEDKVRFAAFKLQQNQLKKESVRAGVFVPKISQADVDALINEVIKEETPSEAGDASSTSIAKRSVSTTLRDKGEEEQGYFRENAWGSWLDEFLAHVSVGDNFEVRSNHPVRPASSSTTSDEYKTTMGEG